MKKFLGFMMMFLGGFVLALNLSVLIPHPPGYASSWVKVVMCFGIAIGGYFLMTSEKERQT